jgi:hypothetical protein
VAGRPPLRRPPAAELVCPGCDATADADARFCPECALPLVFGGGPPPQEPHELEPISDAHRRARLIKPQLAEGKLTKVGWAHNQAEGEFIQSLLLEEGVPSLLRRTAGFDVPDMLAAGPRDVMVPASGVDVARETLLAAAVIDDRPAMRVVTSPARLLCGLLAALAVGALVLWLVFLAMR